MSELIRHGGHRLRRHARQVWASRGGGFYGFVAMIMFLYLEAADLLGDVAGLPQLRPNLGAVITWVVRNAIDALLNFLWSIIWPVQWIGHFGVGLVSAALLAATYATYRLVRPSVLRLLAEPDEVGEPAVKRP